MKFILYSHFAKDNIRDHLGEPEYSYYFVLNAYKRVLAELGTVELVRRPEVEVDPIYRQSQARGEPCLFLTFTPPHKAPLGLECPTMPVIAWEFSTIPDEQWGNDPRNDWRFSLDRFGSAIALSSYSARVIAEAMGPKFKVGAVPAPISNRITDAASKNPICPGTDLHMMGSILDTATMNIQIDAIASSARPQSDGNAVKSIWYRRLVRRGLMWAFASRMRYFELTHGEVHKRSCPKIAPGPESQSAGAPASSPALVHISGVVYTAVLNPDDGRKNAKDILTAFCWAFRETDDATLVLKLVGRDLRAFYNTYVPTLYQLSPFKCRVLVLQSFMEDNEYAKLIGATSFYVNASTSEGLCLPLMEFMSAGTPAIAPVHTAMEDYIDSGVAFTLSATRQITVWPQDTRNLFRTMCFRLDWGSLVEAYQQSYRLAKVAPDAYRAMSNSAKQRMQHYASPASVKDKLRHFFFLSEDSTDSGSYETVNLTTRQSTAQE